MAFYGFTMGAESPQFVGTCNCCICCCGILHGQKISGAEEGPQRSNYRAVIDEEKCIACGLCNKRCPVDVIGEREKETAKKRGKSHVTRDLCIGCGVCVIKCPTQAIFMEPVSEAEWFHNPASMAEWEEMRLKNMAAQK
ncbi:ATP-binding protein [Planctomycetota bacterium]